MTIHSDTVSEKYRKYIVKCITGSKKPLYLFWGTNLQNEDQDYFLLDDNKNILAFTRIKDLVEYVKMDGAVIDPDNTLQWVARYRLNRAYATYDLLHIKSIILSMDETTVPQLYEADVFDLVNFYNFFF